MMPEKSTLLVSHSMRLALENLRDGRRSWAGLEGRSARGGHTGTMDALMDRGLIDAHHELTDKGRSALST
jgi:hypothetical protein